MLTLAACGGSSSGGSSNGGSSTGKTLTVGTSADFPPVSFKKEGSSQIVGFEDNMLQYLTNKIGDKYSWKQLDFNGLIPALQSGRLDLIVSGMYDTAERAQAVDFVDYMKIPLAVLTKKENTAKVSGPMDLCGKSVAYLLGSPPELDQINAWSKACEKAGKSKISSTGFQSVAQAVANVSNGRTFAELEGDIVVLYIANTQYGAKLGSAFNVPGGTSTIGLAVKKGNPLLQQMKDAMAAYIASDQYCTDAHRWSLTASDLMRAC
jgi:ABC-type amino acid transport substrate-binding protein